MTSFHSYPGVFFLSVWPVFIAHAKWSQPHYAISILCFVVVIYISAFQYATKFYNMKLRCPIRETAYWLEGAVIRRYPHAFISWIIQTQIL